MLQLTRSDSLSLHACFSEIDEDGSGQISVDEFLNYVDVEMTPFNERVFGIMDEDGSGEMDFREVSMRQWTEIRIEEREREREREREIVPSRPCVLKILFTNRVFLP